MTVLLIAEHDAHSIKATTLSAVTAAAQLGGEVHVLVLGHACQAAAEAASRIAGVSRVLCADAAHYADQLAENVAALVLAQCAAESAKSAGYSHIVAAATTSGKNFMPRVAALLDVAQISEIVTILASDTFVRPIYAGNILATVQSSDPLKVLTVRSTAFAPASLLAADQPSAPVLPIAALADFGKSRLLSREMTEFARPELTAAKVIVSGGRGLGSAEQYHRLLEPLADKLNAALGASRAAVDAGYVPNDYQVGQTGKIVAPQLYIAIGISGAIQHLAGMKDSKVIVAINKDSEAPIFQVADYGLVGDLFELVPELSAALS
ncbi:MAG: FAD-binding protein [Pseudomonadota bacterium]